MASESSWLDEIDFGPSSRWLSMGTRSLGTGSLGARPWLMADAKREDELALRRRLVSERFDDVVAFAPEVDREPIEQASRAVLNLVRDEDANSPPDPLVAHALVDAGLRVQEDLCLLQRRPLDAVARADASVAKTAWCLDAAIVCFPSRWRLASKIGRPMADVHGPVDGYDAVLESRVDSLLSALVDRNGPGVHRRNWFIHPDASLFQPDRPMDDPLIPAARALDELFVRSERQTLRSIDVSAPNPWVLFTIRTQQEPLRTLLEDSDRAARFATYLESADPDQVRHRGLSDAQTTIVQALL